MNKQQAFETVVNHLISQGVQSTEDGTTRNPCMYRGFNGTKCAIGALIPDDEYDPTMEYRSVSDLAVEGDLPNSIKVLDDVYFLITLQSLHDMYDSYSWNDPDWQSDVKMVAFDYKLNCDFLATKV